MDKNIVVQKPEVEEDDLMEEDIDLFLNITPDSTLPKNLDVGESLLSRNESDKMGFDYLNTDDMSYMDRRKSFNPECMLIYNKCSGE